MTESVKVGDILVSINGISPAGTSAAALSKLVKGAHGSHVMLHFHSIADATVHAISFERICE
jgi:C-terminal processing protease CtpA/Prc